MLDNDNEIVVFLGPSLDRASAEEILPATYRSPASLGDVCDLVLDQDQPPVAIALVDGYFDHTPAVWHKEILFALSQGVAVFGAASMGAIRASELSSFGMVGVGRIYEGFASGAYQDADVALLHTEAPHYINLTVPMVDVYEGLAACIQSSVIGRSTSDLIAQELKALPYITRTPTAVREVVRRLVTGNDELQAAVTAAVLTESKRVDAAELLRRMAQAASRDAWPAPSAFAFEPTYLWQKLCRTVRNARKDQKQDTNALESADALLRLLVRREVDRIGLTLDSIDTDWDRAAQGALIERFRRELS